MITDHVVYLFITLIMLKPKRCAMQTVNRLIYRSKQRGFLELDLLVGQWAERSIPKMSPQGLSDAAAFLDEENPDMFKWLTGQEPVPPRLVENIAYLVRFPVYRRISRSSLSNLCPIIYAIIRATAFTKIHIVDPVV